MGLPAHCSAYACFRRGEVGRRTTRRIYALTLVMVMAMPNPSYLEPMAGDRIEVEETISASVSRMKMHYSWRVAGDPCRHLSGISLAVGVSRNSAGRSAGGLVSMRLPLYDVSWSRVIQVCAGVICSVRGDGVILPRSRHRSWHGGGHRRALGGIQAAGIGSSRSAAVVPSGGGGPSWSLLVFCSVPQAAGVGIP